MQKYTCETCGKNILTPVCAECGTYKNMNPYKPGDKVNYMITDDKTEVYVVYHVYNNTHVSLGLLDYPDTEMDMMVHIANIQPV